MSALVVIEPGLCTTVQDMGRKGYQSLAVPVCGARDSESLRLANILVGNEETTGALEITVLGPTFKVKGGAVRIAVAGAGGNVSGWLEILQPHPRRIPFGRSVTLEDETIFRVGDFSGSFGVVLAVAGGFAIDPVLGSLSTCLGGSFGGFQGRALQRGDILPLTFSLPPDTPEKLYCAASTKEPEDTIIRVVPGPQQDYFTAAAIDTFYTAPYTITADSNRMGLRLSGERLTHNEKGFNLVSDGIVTGAIQVPGNGQPIILFNDHQLTGGYPKIATVISADLPKLGRISPGETIDFKAVGIEQAEAIHRRYKKEMMNLEQKCLCFTSEKEAKAISLAASNLVEGVIDARE